MATLQAVTAQPHDSPTAWREEEPMDRGDREPLIFPQTTSSTVETQPKTRQTKENKRLKKAAFEVMP